MFTKTMMFLSLFIALNAFAGLAEDAQRYYPLIEDETIKLNSNGGQYLSLSMDQGYVSTIEKLIENDLSLSLKDRGEAHITIFNPNEWGTIKNYLSSEELEAFSKVKIKVRCLGRGVVGVKSTYFLIVKSPELMDLREDMVEKVEKKNNIKLNFTPFRPHITVGFTHEDLHYENGVDKSVCWK